MPIYDLQCEDCGNEKLDEFCHLEKLIPTCCGRVMSRKVSRIHPGWPKYGLTLEHVEEKPVHFETKNQLRDYKRKNNLQLGAMPYD
jgi:hypothetical protein